MWSQGGGEPVESYLSKKPLRYIIMLRERNYFISLFQKCQAKKKKKKTHPNLSNHCKWSYCWLFNTSSLLKPTTSVDEPASHFTEKRKETKESFHLFLLPSQPTYLDGWSLLLGKAGLFLPGTLTHLKSLLLRPLPPLASSILLLLWYTVGYFY